MTGSLCLAGFDCLRNEVETTVLGRCPITVRGCLTKLAIPLVLLGLFSYVVLPVLVEDQISRRLQESLGAPTEPEVEVSSSFPPEMLLGRIDRVRVSSDQLSLQGVAFYDARANLWGVSVSLPSLLEGSFRVQARGCSLGASAPPVQSTRARHASATWAWGRPDPLYRRPPEQSEAPPGNGKREILRVAKKLAYLGYAPLMWRAYHARAG